MFKNVFKKIAQKRSGSMLVLVIVANSLFLVMVLGAISVALLQQKLNIRKVARTQALHVAEAGVNYYRWVLYHDHEEYCNKKTCIGAPDYGPYGPYAYTDSAGENIIGYYELYITPPELYGSTIVNIKSIGWVAAYPQIKRFIEVQCGIPSWSNYSTLCDSFIRFGEGTEVWGPLHSNSGIRFDGVAHNIITSYLLEYNDPDHTGPDEYGVHTHVYTAGTYDPDEVSDGSNPPNPPDYTGDSKNPFLAGRSFPTSQPISFNLLGNYATTTYVEAQSNGIILPNSGDEGYHIILTPVPGIQNDILTIKIVNSITAQCWSNSAWQDTDKITNETNFISTTTPPNGIIFIEDNIWVDGQIDGDRLTILAFNNPTTDIIINNDLIYTDYEGLDAIGLIAERNINIGLFSENDLRIDAALIAKEGRIGRNHFNSGCDETYYDRDTITVYGALATKNRYGFAWTDGSGYDNRNIIFDSNLIFSPPPHYPTTGEYTFISWKEK